MIDKVQKIREEIENKLEVMQYQVHRKDAYKELKCVLDYIDSLQEEPVNEDLEKISRNYAYGDDVYFTIKAAFKEVLSGRKKKDESTTENLGKYINELSKQFPEVSFAKLSRIAVRVTKWQKEQIMTKAIDGIARPDDNEIWCNLTSSNFKDGDKVKVIVTKED